MRVIKFQKKAQKNLTMIHVLVVFSTSWVWFFAI